jgi:DNA repair protein RadD
MSSLILRDYQNLSMDGLRDGFAAGHRSQMLYLPTGGGKTEIALAMLPATADKGNRCAIVLDRRVLVDQTSVRMDKYDIDHGVLMAGHRRYLTYKSIQVCSAQTLEKRGSFPNLKLLIVDEAHNTRRTTAEFIKNNPHVKVIGLSASPFTKGLGSIYSNVVSQSTTKQLVDMGSLAPLRVFIAKEIDMAGAKKVGGEWSSKEAGARGIQITGDIVSEWIKKTYEIFAEPKKTVVFCAGVAHGQDLSAKFKDAGYNFVSVSYKDDEDSKQEILREFSKPDSTIHGLIATDILTKGFDQADVMVGISARPFTKSFSNHVQQLGRIMRPHANKEAGIWLDHSGNFLRFQDQWDDLYHNGVSELNDGVEKPKKEPTKKVKEAAKCPKCGELWQTNGDICQHCGHVRIRRDEVVTLPGQLSEVMIGKSVAAKDNKDLWLQLCTYVSQKGNKPGRAAHLYLKIIGEYPKFKFDGNANVPVSAATLGKIKSLNIAFSKRRTAA